MLLECGLIPININGNNAMSDDSHLNETYKSLITISIEGFKFCALANGGAAVAILAYLGNVAAKSVPVPDMQCAMGWFLAGLVTCGLAMFFSYQTQLQLFQEEKKKRDVSEPECIKCREREIHNNACISHVAYLQLAMLFVFLSVCAFGVGAFAALQVF
jgi:hypothetical protein